MSVWKKYGAIVALALSLPSTILVVCYVAYTLHKKGIISEGFGLIIIVVSIFNILYLMIRYVLKRKN
jgi:hypothetical protein